MDRALRAAIAVLGILALAACEGPLLTPSSPAVLESVEPLASQIRDTGTATDMWFTCNVAVTNNSPGAAIPFHQYSIRVRHQWADYRDNAGYRTVSARFERTSSSGERQWAA